MIRSDRSAAGVAFTLDTQSGFEDLILINGAWGLGENVVKGKINPDQYFVFKPTLKKGFRAVIRKNLGNKEKKLIYLSRKEQTSGRILKKIRLTKSSNQLWEGQLGKR